MLSKSHQKQVELASIPFKRQLSNYSEKELEVYNEVISTFQTRDYYKQSSGFIADIGINVAMYSLQNIPNDPKITPPDVYDNLDPLILQDMKENNIYFKNIDVDIYNDRKFERNEDYPLIFDMITSRWPDIPEKTAIYLQDILDSYGEFFLDKSHVDIFRFMDKAMKPNNELGKYFYLI